MERLRRPSAFTLIELLVVILVIGILIAVAAPSFLGQADKAKESAAKQELAVAYKAAKAAAVDSEGSYTALGLTALVSSLAISEPQLSFLASATEVSGKIAVTLNGSTLELRNVAANGVLCTLIAPVNAQITVGCAGEAAAAADPPSPVVSGLPAISGEARQSVQLTASTGTWTSAALLSYSYQWRRCDASGSSCAAIGTGDANDDNDYTLTATDVGSTVRVRVTATNSGGTDFADSAQTAVVVQSYPQVVLADSPTGYWRFGEASGTTATDASGNGNAGSYANVTLAQPGALSYDSAASFNGSSSIVTNPLTSTTAQMASFTLEAWFKKSSISTGQQWIAGLGATQFVIEANTGKAKFLIFNSVSFQETASAGALTDGNWHHLVGTWDATNKERLYIDGVLAATNAGATAPVSNGSPLTIGAYPGSQFFTGSLDEVAVYFNQSLTPAQVQAHYNAR